MVPELGLEGLAFEEAEESPGPLRRLFMTEGWVSWGLAISSTFLLIPYFYSLLFFDDFGLGAVVVGGGIVELLLIPIFCFFGFIQDWANEEPLWSFMRLSSEE